MNDEKERRERMMDSQRDYGDETRDEPVIGLWAGSVSLGELSAAERVRFESMQRALRVAEVVAGAQEEAASYPEEVAGNKAPSSGWRETAPHLTPSHQEHVPGVHDRPSLPFMRDVFEKAADVFSSFQPDEDKRRSPKLDASSAMSWTLGGNPPAPAMTLVAAAVLAEQHDQGGWRAIADSRARVLIRVEGPDQVKEHLSSVLEYGVMRPAGVFTARGDGGSGNNPDSPFLRVPKYNGYSYSYEFAHLRDGSVGKFEAQVVFHNGKESKNGYGALYREHKAELSPSGAALLLAGYLYGQAGLDAIDEAIIQRRPRPDEEPLHYGDVAIALDAGPGTDAFAAVMSRVTRPRSQSATPTPGRRKPSDEETLDDIKGYGEVKEVLTMMAEDLQAYLAGEIDWDDATCSALVYGEPGCGKTHIAQALARSIPGAKAFITSFAQWQSHGHMGDTLHAMRKVFSQALAAAPAVIFIDEIDSLGTRGDDQRNKAYMTGIINGFLEVMNKDSRKGVIVIAACNSPDELDPAIKRDGRFDHKIEVMLPGREATEDILRKNLPEGFDVAALMDASIGQTPANINGAVRKAKSRARIKKVALTPDLILREMSATAWRRAESRLRAAAHECAHAIVARAVGGKRVKRVVVRADGAGAAYFEGGMGEGRMEDVTREIAVLMAGKVGETVICGEHSAGIGGSQQSDLARATHLAIGIDARFGLGEGADFYYGGKDHEWLMSEPAREKATAIVREGEALARRIIGANDEVLRGMTEALRAELVMDEDAMEPWLSRVVPA